MSKELNTNKKVTPTGTKDWYVKWCASIIVLVAMCFRSAGGFAYIDLVLTFIGAAGWLYVSVAWKDRALIMLNTAAVIISAIGLINLL